MNTAPLKTLAFWLSLIPALLGLLVAQGVVLSGSTVDHVVGYIVTILGIFVGHNVAGGAPAGQTTATSPANPPPAA